MTDRTRVWGMVLCVMVARATAEQPTFLLVAADGSGDHETIQEAVDAAAPGALIRVAAGVYEGRVRIEKKVLTIEGAGWEDTRLVADHGGERKAVLSVRDAEGVTLRGLRLTLRGETVAGAVMDGFVLSARNSSVLIEECAVVGSPASGIGVLGGDVVIRACRIAGVWATGVAVYGPPEVATQFRIADSTVRNCHHRGITIAGSGAIAVVERCRISGSAWHGIRYDDASPRIEGNLIFANARSGIYASGQTSAKVIGNLFWKNDMDGISCWMHNRDTIRQNTFAANRREGLAIVGAARPRLERNVFFGNPVAITLSSVADGGDDAELGRGPEMVGNLFWQNHEVVTGPPEVTQALPEARIDDPGFAAPARGDFSLPPASLAWREGLGAARPSTAPSPWPIQPEEEPIAAELVREARAEEGMRTQHGAHAIAEPWVRAIMQLDSDEERSRAVAAVRDALASEDPRRRAAGLMAFVRTYEVNYDRTGFRELILPLAREPSPGSRVFYALLQVGIEPGDRTLLLAAARDPSPDLLESLTHLLQTFGDGEITGESADLVLDLLEKYPGRERRMILHGMGWGATISPELEARVLDIARNDATHRHDAYYFVLSRFPEKSQAVVTALLEGATADDFEVASISVFGLGQGIPPESQDEVADTLLKLLETRNAPWMHRHLLPALGTMANASHVERIEKLIGNEASGEDLRKQLQEILATAKKKKFF